MTDREALIILAAGFADTQYTAANAVDEAIEALSRIDEHIERQERMSQNRSGCTVSGSSISWPKEPSR